MRWVFSLALVFFAVATAGADNAALHLELEMELAAPRHRELWLDLPPAAFFDLGPESPRGAASAAPEPLSLSAADEGLRFNSRPESLELLNDLEKSLAAERPWSTGKTRLEHHVAGEEARVRDGGLVGDSGRTALMFDVLAVVKIVKNLVKKFKRARQPEGAKVARDGEMTILLGDYDGQIPTEISVLPLILGYVGDTVHVVCDASGSCTVPRIPREEFSMLVQAAGVSGFVPAAGAGTHTALVLRPSGLLRLRTDDPDGNWKARVVHQPSGAAVPVSRWLNPLREAWVAVPAGGLPLQLPPALYEIQWRAPDGTRSTSSLRIGSGQSIEVDARDSR